MGAEALREPVDRFIDDIGAVVDGFAEASGMQADRLGPDPVAVEAYNLAAAFIDADGLHTDEELAEFLAAFASRFETLLRFSTPGQLRKAALLVGKRAWVEGPSLLFDTLVRADRLNGTAHAWTYYERALDVAHTVCSLDDYPSHTELATVDRFRNLLLRTMELAGVTRERRRPDPAAQPHVAAEPAKSVEELLAELDALIGLAAVKAEVRLVVNLYQVQRLRRSRGLPVAESSRHLVFTGNPGTGKTTVARLIGQLYRAIGVVEQGHLVETDRAGLVAGYVGQTATRVHEVFERAMGGVLLIDEAYALVRGSEQDFGREAIDTLVKLIEDHRDDVVVIMTGYPAEMEDLVEANPGLRSRFPRTIFFEDYSNDELLAIFDAFCKHNGYAPSPEARAAVLERLAGAPRERGFGNARLVRNLFEHAVAAQASRVVGLADPTNEQLCALLPEDVVEARA